MLLAQHLLRQQRPKGCCGGGFSLERQQDTVASTAAPQREEQTAVAGLAVQCKLHAARCATYVMCWQQTGFGFGQWPRRLMRSDAARCALTSRRLEDCWYEARLPADEECFRPDTESACVKLHPPMGNLNEDGPNYVLGKASLLTYVKMPAVS